MIIDNDLDEEWGIHILLESYDLKLKRSLSKET